MKISENKQDDFSRSITLVIIQTLALICMIWVLPITYSEGAYYGFYFLLAMIILGAINLFRELVTIKKLLEK